MMIDLILVVVGNFVLICCVFGLGLNIGDMCGYIGVVLVVLDLVDGIEVVV